MNQQSLLIAAIHAVLSSVLKTDHEITNSSELKEVSVKRTMLAYFNSRRRCPVSKWDLALLT